MQADSNITKQWWSGRTVAFGTMHEKESIVRPILERGLGVRVIVPEHFDTDRFGTFTGERKRRGTQLEAARAKARAAIAATGAEIGLASEGSFDADPQVPFLTRNIELLLLIDTVNELEVIGHYRSHTVRAKQRTIRSTEEGITVAREWGFPTQGVIVRRSARSRKMEKELTTEASLHRYLTEQFTSPLVRTLSLETDLRAHRCPARRANIVRAAESLAEACRSTCPECARPGFVPTDHVRGLPCGTCGTPTERIESLILTCHHCEHTTKQPATEVAYADPADCSRCNP